MKREDSNDNSNLEWLLKNLNPRLDPEKYAYCALGTSIQTSFDVQKAFALIQEKEGWTLITTVAHAHKEGFSIDALFRKITLEVQSSLDAVGLTAVISSALAQKGCSANIVAGKHHDHIFVSEDKHHLAFETIKSIQTTSV